MTDDLAPASIGSALPPGQEADDVFRVPATDLDDAWTERLGEAIERMKATASDDAAMAARRRWADTCWESLAGRRIAARGDFRAIAFGIGRRRAFLTRQFEAARHQALRG